MQAAIDRAETLAALRWTSPVQPDVGVPKTGYSQGWDYNSYSQRVWIGWSSTVSHGTGVIADARFVIGVQGARKMYSTKTLALAAMRHELEKKAAADLLKIDRLIATALDTSGTEAA